MSKNNRAKVWKHRMWRNAFVELPTMRASLLLFFLLSLVLNLGAQTNASFRIGKLKYEGGGDWYANPSSLPNLFKFIQQNTRMRISLQEEVVEPSSPLAFQYPMLYMTGHGNVLFNEMEVKNLRKYLLAGGFLLIDDNYGMNKYIVREIKKIFPEYQLANLPTGHPIFHQQFDFPNGIPKIHEHDGKPAEALGIIHEGRLVLLLTYECDLGDGWEDARVHNDSEALRQQALRMGSNVVQYVLTR
jgi:hypothetical protein